MDDDRFDALVGIVTLPAIVGLALGLAIGRQFGSLLVGVVVGLTLATLFAWVRMRLTDLPR